MFAVRKATRANLPIRYAFSFVIEAPPSMAKASRPYCDLNFADGLDGAIQRFIPCGFAKTVVRADQRREQPVGMFVLQVALDALGAEHAAIDRELFPRLEADDLVVVNLELNAALHAAEAAMRLHERAVRLLRPAAGRLVVQVRAVPVDEGVSSSVGIAMAIVPAPFPDSGEQPPPARRADILVMEFAGRSVQIES